MSRITYLDPEIANEGRHAEAPLVDDYTEEGEYQPAIDKPNIPDYKGIKSIAKYFPQYSNRPYVKQPWPAWFYHKKQGAKMARNAAEASKFGITWDKKTLSHVCTGEWHAEPFELPKPSAVGPGKGLVRPGAERNTDDMIAAVVAAVVAKVNGAAPPKVAEALQSDPDYAEFLQFKAFKAQQAGGARSILDEDDVGLPTDVAYNALASEPTEKELLIQVAAEKNIKIDKRWTVDKIKALLDEAA